MQYKRFVLHELGVRVEASVFTADGGVTEWHVMLHVEPQGDLFEGQLQRVYQAEDLLPTLPEFAGARYIFKRYFLSDSANQAPLMRKEEPSSLSVIQQQPLDGSKIAVWAYLASGMNLSENHGFTVAEHNGYRHLWLMSQCHAEGDSARQTEALLQEYEALLGNFGATLADNCIRTWFFVRDVDTQYGGMVRARREFFASHGLTKNTHFIASTGIGGQPADVKALVQMGSYALTGFSKQQLNYLRAPSHLNPTSDYGVTFERGSTLDFGDRRHVIISGTASINNKGLVMCEGDIVGQTHRMLENVEALLAEGGATYDDVAQIVVYLRDTADYELVHALFTNHFPQIPTVITLAPVCRPAWLIEIECLAVKAQSNPSFRAL
ncbi:MAG: hypothetical protein LUB62_04750 [Prevotellaceae bacterium]|nr:hypothetical protein [Prevotellaceae bacterium]